MATSPIRLSRQQRNDLLYIAVRGMYALAPAVPRPIGLWICGFMGGLIFRIPSADRNRTIENLRNIYKGEWTESRILAVAAEVYRGLGRTFFDTLTLGRLPIERLEKFIRCDDIDIFQSAYEQHKGMIGISAHCGTFELLLPYFAKKGFSCFAIGAELFDKRLDDMISAARSGPNMSYVHRDNAGRVIIRNLNKGMVFGALIDQDTNVEGVFADFLGQLAYTPCGPIKLAMKMKIPVIVATTARQPDNTHRISVVGPIPLDDTGDPRRDLVMNVQKVNDRIGSAIRRHPDQWVWMHRRWNRNRNDVGLENTASIEDYRQGAQG